MSGLSHKSGWVVGLIASLLSLLWPPYRRQFLTRAALSTLVTGATAISVWSINLVARARRRLLPGTKRDLRDLRAHLDRKALLGLRANRAHRVQPVLRAMKS
jgi:hypothetical protein